MKIQEFSAAALDLLFPPRCAFCGTILDHSGDGVCSSCRKKLPSIEDANALRQVGNFPCAVAFYYEEPVRQGVLALKFGKKSWRAKVFGRYVAQTAAEFLGGQFDAVTYVPISRKRYDQRGFDQARLIAQSAARQWGVPVQHTVKKTRNNRAQSSLDDPNLRRENVRDVYTVPHPERVRDRRFLLIDDVVTTGSTLSACAEALLAAGAASVVCAALAGGHPGNTLQTKSAQLPENSAIKL